MALLWARPGRSERETWWPVAWPSPAVELPPGEAGTRRLRWDLLPPNKDAVARLYDQMPEPKYVISMGACASGGGPFKEGYNVVSGIDKYLPVDVYVPGCPPTPQALLNGLIMLQKKIDGEKLDIPLLGRKGTTPWYVPDADRDVTVPVLGPDR